MKRSIFISLCCVFISLSLQAQEEEVPLNIYLPEYGYLAIEVNTPLNDTVKIKYSENVFFRFVFFDFRGKSYCEVYKYNKLLEKGYYENSLDTLKDYAGLRNGSTGKTTKLQVHKYFQPLKNGEWTELVKGKYLKRTYVMGIKQK